MNPPTREERIAKAQCGDRSALDDLLSEHRSRLAASICSRLAPALRRKIDVEDVLQETFLRAFRSIDRFQYTDEDSFLRWLVGIAGNVIREVAKRERWELIVPLDAVPRADDVSPSKAGRREERFDRLQRALGALSPDHRQVVVLARLERLPLKEVARRMGRSPGAVKQLLLRALVRLRDSFGNTDSYHLPQRDLAEKEEGHAP